MNTKYLIPPKLRQEFLLAGFTVLELLIGVAWLLISFTTHHYTWLWVLAVAFPLFCRFDGNSNGLYYLILFIRFYGGTREFGRR
ncbi:hypothetical protein [Pygmaiobacter massiliensis]|uniref:hypothetical protein n=1 Tax=Pygmaiobacter massiliensis TaxID=1917873 RepID=UPI000C7B5998|nr:hypothetical protein [Pygmaiobacter massiliensis]MDY4785551.1 hypothetical protein [Pygmaiobacter massiliensis]